MGYHFLELVSLYPEDLAPISFISCKRGKLGRWKPKDALLSMSDNSNTGDPNAPVAPAETTAAPIGTSWQEQDGVLRDLWMQNKTPQEIGDVLGRSIPAIMTRAARLGLPRRTAPGRKPGAGGTRRLQPYGGEGENVQQQKRSITSSPVADTMSQAQLRVCLMCLRKFESAGRHNRICSPCKGSAEYVQAATLPDVHLPQS